MAAFSIASIVSSRPFQTPGVRADFTEEHFDAGWRREFDRLLELGKLPRGWDGGEAIAARNELIAFAFGSLQRFTRISPPPSFSTDADGDVWALWAAQQLDIEVHFRAPDDAFVMIEDARGVLPEFTDEDPSLRCLTNALIELGNRARAAAHDERRSSNSGG